MGTPVRTGRRDTIEVGVNGVRSSIAVAPPRGGRGPYRRKTPLDDGVYAIDEFTDGTWRLHTNPLCVVWERLR